MHIEENLWHSPHLDREMVVKVYGHWGHDVNHDWPWWYKQMNYFLECLYA